MSRPLLRMTGIAKRFPGVQALDNVALEVGEGEVHGLLGENGAGKSTLLKILAGAQTPDAGEIEFAGATVTLPNPQASQALGIVTIYQEFNLIPSMTVEENLFLGREPVTGPFVELGGDAPGDAGPGPAAWAGPAGGVRWCAISRSPSSRWWRSPARSPCARG